VGARLLKPSRQNKNVLNLRSIKTVRTGYLDGIQQVVDHARQEPATGGHRPSTIQAA